MREETRKNIREWLKTILSAVAAALIITQFIIPTSVYGISMEPTFEHEDYLLISKQAYAGNRHPERGDVIVFQSHLKDSESGELMRLIKRVVAVSGDTIEIKDGKVYINGGELEEDYIKDGVTNGEVGPVTIPKGYLFCMGDNRLHSTDSRALEVGLVSEDAVLGKVFFRLYPLDDFGIIGS